MVDIFTECMPSVFKTAVRIFHFRSAQIKNPIKKASLKADALFCLPQRHRLYACSPYGQGASLTGGEHILLAALGPVSSPTLEDENEAKRIDKNSKEGWIIKISVAHMYM